jgi:hypothetical protein
MTNPTKKPSNKTQKPVRQRAPVRYFHKAWDDDLDNHVLQSLDPATFRFLHNLRCLLSRHHTHIIPRMAHLAFMLRASIEEAASHIQALVQAEIIIRGVLNGSEVYTLPDMPDRRQALSTERARKSLDDSKDNQPTVIHVSAYEALSPSTLLSSHLTMSGANTLDALPGGKLQLGSATSPREEAVVAVSTAEAGGYACVHTHEEG